MNFYSDSRYSNFRFKRYISTAIFISSCLTLSLFNSSVSAQEHMEEEAHEEKGPHGGLLLEQDNIAVEVTIFETGIPPEMRIYAYQNQQLLSAKEYQVQVVLDRLGGVQDQISFTAEQDYNVSNQSIAEPHSYDVTVKAVVNNKTFEWQYDSHEGRAKISDRILKLAGVKTEVAQAQTINKTDTLFGVISPAQDKVFNLHAPYSSIVENVYVQMGDVVTKGQKLVSLRNTETLQSYSLKSPANGEITARLINKGDRADQNTLLEISDLSQVWVDISAFPENIENLAIGQDVSVYDMHNHEKANGKIIYVAPQMTGGHIARARAVISNPDGHWRPGMHIKADISISQRQVSLAVKTSALQTFREMPVVFARYGNTFEVRMVKLGEQNDEWIEVTGGLEPGTEYVTENSFLLKADVLKDGASHDH